MPRASSAPRSSGCQRVVRCASSSPRPFPNGSAELALYGTFARMLEGPAYEIGAPLKVFDALREDTGRVGRARGTQHVRASMLEDERYRGWWARLLRSRPAPRPPRCSSSYSSWTPVMCCPRSRFPPSSRTGPATSRCRRPMAPTWLSTSRRALRPLRERRPHPLGRRSGLAPDEVEEFSPARAPPAS